MPPWLGVVLIITSLTALGLALYCRIFMAPLERFRERVNALGGGLKGIESHFTGVAGELHERVEALEEKTSGQITETRESLQGAVEGQARDLREVRREVDKLRRELQAVQEELHETTASVTRSAQAAESLAKQLGQFRSDFDALDVELRESVRQLVADSLATVESTVLAALEAIQEEILHGVPEPSGTPGPFGTRRDSSKPAPSFDSGAGRGRRENIITVEPLFAGMRQKGQQTEPDESGKEEEPAPEGEDES